MSEEQLAGLGDYEQNPAFSELERLVLTYAEELTLDATVDEELHAALAKNLSPREILDLAVTVAAANFTNRVTAALAPDPEPPRPDAGSRTRPSPA